MKTIIFSLTILLGSFIINDVTAAPDASAKYSGYSPFVSHEGAKRFKSGHKIRRGKKTCMKKGGCNGKSNGLFKKHRGCARYY